MFTPPSSIYGQIKSVYPYATTICKIHKPCGKSPRCESISMKEVLEFDRIKECEDKKKGKGITRKSVDAVTYTDNDTYFCFVEIKGWKDYLHHNSAINVREIWKKVKDYKLDKKLDDSIEIAREVVGNNIFDETNVCYIIVTDIDTRYEVSLVQVLMFISMSASKCSDACNTLLRNTLEGIMSRYISDVKKLYISCHEFDKTMAIL